MHLGQCKYLISNFGYAGCQRILLRIPFLRTQSKSASTGREVKMASTKSSSKNNNSTRLPPKNQQKKKGGKAGKVNIKRIVMDEKEKAEQLKDTLESLTERLLTVLDSGGVPKEHTQDIQKQLLLVCDNDTSASLTEQVQRTLGVVSNATRVVEMSWSGKRMILPPLHQNLPLEV